MYLAAGGEKDAPLFRSISPKRELTDRPLHRVNAWGDDSAKGEESRNTIAPGVLPLDARYRHYDVSREAAARSNTHSTWPGTQMCARPSSMTGEIQKITKDEVERIHYW